MRRQFPECPGRRFRSGSYRIISLSWPRSFRRWLQGRVDSVRNISPLRMIAQPSDSALSLDLRPTPVMVGGAPVIQLTLTPSAARGLHYADATEDLRLSYVKRLRGLPCEGYVVMTRLTSPDHYEATYLRLLGAVIRRRLMAAESRFAPFNRGQQLHRGNRPFEPSLPEVNRRRFGVQPLVNAPHQGRKIGDRCPRRWASPNSRSTRWRKASSLSPDETSSPILSSHPDFASCAAMPRPLGRPRPKRPQPGQRKGILRTSRLKSSVPNQLWPTG